MAQQELSSEEIYGIAKRINKELEVTPMHTHSAICEMIRVGMQHRNLAMQAQNNADQKEQQDRVLAIQEHQVRMQREQADKAAQVVPFVNPPN
jgi:hypothetical protein